MTFVPLNYPLNSEDRERLEHLLLDEVTQGLGTAERDELEFLLQAGGGAAVEDATEQDLLGEAHRIAALAELSLLEAEIETGSSMPEEIPPLVEADLRSLAAAEAKRVASGKIASIEDSRKVNLGLSPAWWIAAAAGFLALLGWWPQLPFTKDRPVSTVATVERPGDRLADRPTLSPSNSGQEESREETDGITAATRLVNQLLDDTQTLTLTLTATDDPTAAGATGTLLWNPRLQEGAMQISGLARNQPSEFQYQLWIFDSQRDERYPVDGGVFDMRDDGSISVFIDPRVPVTQATLFAITIEPPGGVVVSDRERIVLVAQPS